MPVRTYYWNTKKVSTFKYYSNKILRRREEFLRYGNAGDIFNRDLITFLYHTNPINIEAEGNRLLLVGSVMSILEKGDIVNGIGWKGNDLSAKREEIASAKVYGVRGPLTKQLFEDYGADLSDLKFEYDPGLLIKEVYGIDNNNASQEDVLFIPHFRDTLMYMGHYPKGIKVVHIDSHPKKLAKEILKAKVVYTSSLHGIIFSHSLKKECIFVAPQSREPIIKYKDYYHSIGLEMPEPVKNIHSLNFRKDKPTVLNRNITIDDFYFPDISTLKKTGILIS